MCRGYEHYGRLSMTTKVLCTVHANPSSRISWQAAADEQPHSQIYPRNITLREQVCLLIGISATLSYFTVSGYAAVLTLQCFEAVGWLGFGE